MIDHADCPFEVLGYFEELDDVKTGKFLGIRICLEPDRPFGFGGRKEFFITETLTLRKGHKEVTLKASPKQPKKVIGTLQILCGKVKVKI